MLIEQQTRFEFNRSIMHFESVSYLAKKNTQQQQKIE